MVAYNKNLKKFNHKKEDIVFNAQRDNNNQGLKAEDLVKILQKIDK